MQSERQRFEDLHDVLTVKEAARFLGIGRYAYYSGCERDELPHIRLGTHRIIVPKAMLGKFLAGEPFKLRDIA